MAKTVEELKVRQRALELCDAVDAIIERPRLVADRRLRDQIRDAADSILSNIAEGFEQATDRAFARANEVGQMLTGFIKYLHKSDRKRRGLGKKDPSSTTQTNDSDEGRTTLTNDLTNDPD